MTPARFRNWILVLGVALIAAIAGFFFHARWLGRRLGRDVPSQLAKTIQQSTQGFTHSESRGGHTIYTLHASKAVQFKSDGHAELHDVSITLYNAQGAPANRIYGHSFDWDPAHGIARALGEVEIDFEGQASSDGKGSGPGMEAGESKNTVHVKTSGLVYNKQTGLASTTETLEFRLSAAAGSAVGASFDSRTGIMILMSNVAFNSSIGGSPLSVRAHHAQFDRENRLLYLLQDVTDFQDSQSSSDQATVAFRPDGSASEVEAEGNVVLTGGNGQKVNSRKAHVDLDAKSAPRQVKLDGGLLYVAAGADRQMHGSASSGTMTIGPQLSLQHAQLRDAVSLVDVETFPAAAPRTANSKAGRPESSSRQVQASVIDVDFVTGPDRDPLVHHVVATGGARLNVHTIYRDTPPQDTTVQGDQLTANLSDSEVLTNVQGNGHTRLVDLSPNRVKQTSTGDQLLLTFAPASQSAVGAGKTSRGKAAAPAPQAVAQLQSAVQQGHVNLTQEIPPDPGHGKEGAPATPSVTTAAAGRAAYDAATQIVQLSGDPRVASASGELNAQSIEMEHLTGNANASGGVKATYRQPSGQPGVAFSSAGPVHVVADHAHLEHATDMVTFYGKTAVPARLWQGDDSVAAPVLELSQARATLNAHAAHGEPSAVTAFFSSEQGSGPGHAGPPRAAGPSLVRIQSRTLLYDDAAHRATFSGGVVAQNATGSVRANTISVFLLPASSPGTTGKAPARQSGSVEKIVAHGAVELIQPGRKGMGEELTYTAADSQYLLTGTSTTAPRLSDQVRGAVTGTSLIFNDRDDSVIVSGGNAKAVTQTRVAR